jgi:hypothetical protein
MPLTNDEKDVLTKKFRNILIDLVCVQSIHEEPVYDEKGLRAVKVSDMIDNFEVLAHEFNQMHIFLVRSSKICADRTNQSKTREQLYENGD